MVGFNLHRYDILLFCHGPTERIYVGIGRHFHGQVVHYGLRRFHGNITRNVFVPFPYWVNVVRGTSEP